MDFKDIPEEVRKRISSDDFKAMKKIADDVNKRVADFLASGSDRPQPNA